MPTNRRSLIALDLHAPLLVPFAPDGHSGVRKYPVASPLTSGTTEHTPAGHIMDAEQINQIGSNLADLSARTVELRGYL